MAVVRLSPSRIDNYRKCPAYFNWTEQSTSLRSDSVHTALGKAAHSVHELVGKWPSMPVDQRVRYMLDNQFLDYVEDAKEVMPSGAFKQGLLSRLYADNCEPLGVMTFHKGYLDVKNAIQFFEVPEGWKLVSAEQKFVMSVRASRDHKFDGDFLVVVPGVTQPFDMSYIIDAVFERPDGIYQIIDYKTAANPPKDPLQLELYIWAECLRNGHAPQEYEAAYWMTRTNKVHNRPATKTTEEMTEYVHGLAVEIAARRAEKDWPTTPSGSSCFFCKRDCPDRYNS